ncbi:hypothetical protein XFF6990_90110 [Xanthomonas citri pv. fuscans]|uniref:Uncharacterized protein n=1 Tax=Xanthomonas campestris pv. phaseoli TaxID=317013 RepID=A0A7Z7IZB1_XANCH|nr:hypothetical protein XFF6990_90110 [Xanthomonas citri pv. fuscans]SOO23134.1 hypothetical protein XFF6991_180245 [Xanthomonas phaseoli pv. phaseoli]
MHGQVLDAQMRAFYRMPSDSTSVALIDSLSQQWPLFLLRRTALTLVGLQACLQARSPT